MLFNKAKSAFRAGTVAGPQWNDANTGQASSAIGEDIWAAHDHSHIIGRNGITRWEDSFVKSAGIAQIDESLHGINIKNILPPTLIGHEMDIPNDKAYLIEVLVCGRQDITSAGGTENDVYQYRLIGSAINDGGTLILSLPYVSCMLYPTGITPGAPTDYLFTLVAGVGSAFGLYIEQTVNRNTQWTAYVTAVEA